jgi:hypothetical protein
MRALLHLITLASGTWGAQSTGAQQLDVEYAHRAIDALERLAGVDVHAIARLRDGLSAAARAADDATLSRALDAAFAEIDAIGERSRPAGSRSITGAVSFEEVVASELGWFASSIAWALDRPVPWERDCSCCYPFCPADRWCIKQADKRYLACAGYSVRQHLSFAIVDHARLSAFCIAVALVVVDRWLSVPAALAGGRGRRGRTKASKERGPAPDREKLG